MARLSILFSSIGLHNWRMLIFLLRRHGREEPVEIEGKDDSNPPSSSQSVNVLP